MQAITDLRKATGDLSPKTREPVKSEHKDKRMPNDSALRIPAWALGILIGLMVTVVGEALIMAQWKGSIDTRLVTIEDRQREDRQAVKDSLEYIRTQNEVNGKDLARIRVYFENLTDKRK